MWCRYVVGYYIFFFSSRRRHTRFDCDWSSDVCSSDLDPQRADCRSEAKELCGTGVAFKLAQALVPALGLSPHLPLHFLDLVALATVADVVPLTGENRILVRHGLKLLAESHWTGVRALIETAGRAPEPVKSGPGGVLPAPRLHP